MRVGADGRRWHNEGFCGMFAWLKDKTGRLWRWHVRQVKAFFNGFSHPFRAIPYIFRNPSLLKWAIPPAILTSGLMALVMWTVFGYTDDAVSLIWTQPAGTVWYETWLLLPIWYTIYVVAMLILVAIGIIAVYLVSIPLAGPFGELLAEEVEKIETGWSPPFDWMVLLRNLAVTALHLTIFTMMQIVVFAMVSAIGLIPIVGQVISIVVSLVTTPLLIGFAPFDYPMTVRLWGFGDKMQFMVRNFPMFYGFSVASFAMLYIPFVNLVFLPCCVVAASRVIVEQEKDGTLTIADRRKAVLAARNKLTLAAAEKANAASAQATSGDADAVPAELAQEVVKEA